MTIYNMLKTVRNRITMNPAKESLEGVGVSVCKENGEVKASVSVIEDLGSKWETFTDEQKKDISVAVAGKYHLSRFVLMMNNWK